MKNRWVLRAIALGLCLGTVSACTQARASVGDWFTVDEINYSVTEEDQDRGKVMVMGGTDQLVEAIIPESVSNEGCTYTVTQISESAFYWYPVEMTRLVIPKTVIEIGNQAIGNKPNLPAIEVANDNPNYASWEGMLMDKTLTTLICYPAGKPGEVFEIPENVTTIGDFAFSWGVNLKEITIPEHVTSLGWSAFASCSSLEKVTLAAKLDVLPESTFFFCSNLTTVTLPPTLKEIGNGAFGNCGSLTRLDIPKNVQKVCSGAFHAPFLTTVIFWGNAPEAEEDLFLDEAGIVYYQEGTTGWGETFAGRPTAVWSPEPEKPVVHFDPPVIEEGKLVFKITCTAGSILESSTDMKTWTEVQVPESGIYTVDTTSGKSTYYRIKAEQ